MTEADLSIPMLGDPAEIRTPGARQFWRQRRCPTSKADVSVNRAQAGHKSYILWVIEHDGRGHPLAACPGHRRLLAAPESIVKFAKKNSARISLCTCQGEFIE